MIKFQPWTIRHVIDLNEGTINLFSNTGTIRRIDDTSSLTP